MLQRWPRKGTVAQATSSCKLACTAAGVLRQASGRAAAAGVVRAAGGRAAAAPMHEKDADARDSNSILNKPTSSQNNSRA